MEHIVPNNLNRRFVMNVNKIYKNTFVLISIFLGYFSCAFGIELKATGLKNLQYKESDRVLNCNKKYLVLL